MSTFNSEILLDNIVKLRLKEMYTWIIQKKHEILMEAKKRFKFYTTTVMRVEM